MSSSVERESIAKDGFSFTLLLCSPSFCLPHLFPNQLFFDGERMDEAENQHLSNGDLFELKDLASQSLSLVIREYKNNELFHTHQVRLDLEDNPTVYDSE